MRVRTAAALAVLLVAVVLIAVLVLRGGGPDTTAFQPGAPGVGDPYFPTYGNGGYDVTTYDLKIRYDPATDRLDGTATLTATSALALSRFDLDLAGGLTVSAVTVDGRAAAAQQQGAELVVTPVAGIAKGRAFTAVVTYGGVPQRIKTELGEGGWLHTADGGVALGQPESASGWYPVNDHPSDKATYTLEATVPDGVEALGNGVPGERTSANGWTTWRWREATPMASYLSTVVIGQYRVTSGTHRGRPMVLAVPESLPPDGFAQRSMDATGEVADFIETVAGPYPFEAYGGIVVADPRIRYALETQARPVYGDTFFGQGTDTSVVAHELAHQWYGDSVSIRQWKDVWLNEGFATYVEWLWNEHDRRDSVDAQFDRQYAAFDWSVRPGDPGRGQLFGRAVYQRGAMTVHALRRAVGDDAFFRILKGWPAEMRDRNASTADFVAFAERVSGRQLDDLFQSWLFGTTRPANPRP